MVKIKDFTIGTKKLGGGTCPTPPPVPYTTSAHDCSYKFESFVEDCILTQLFCYSIAQKNSNSKNYRYTE